MNDNTWDRSVRLAEYMIAHSATVRATAKIFGISKSTVHTNATVGNGFLFPKAASPEKVSGAISRYAGISVVRSSRGGCL